VVPLPGALIAVPRVGRLRILFGLRPRLLAALMLTSAVTLAAAAIALLSPLEAKLRQDSISQINAEVAGLHAAFEGIPLNADGTPFRPALRREVRHLADHYGLTVTVLDRNLQYVYGTPIELVPHEEINDVRQALGKGVANESVDNGILQDADPVLIGGAGPPSGRGLRFGLALRRSLNYVGEAGGVVRTAFITAAAVGLGTALLLGIIITTTLLRRLERLRNATREMERRGLDAPPPPVNGSDEIAELARAFASMQSRLRRQEEARRAFVATASHELRTPLASLDGMLELLEDDLRPGALDLDDARMRTGSARQQSERLRRLATDLLDVSRLDAEVTLRSEAVELGEVTRAVVAEFERRAAGAQVSLIVDSPAASCWAWADPGSVARIVRILVDNALRVAPGSTEVHITIEQRTEWTTARVSDGGPGVAMAERELIFERFRRGSAGQGNTGFGLGLAIGRELAVRMGGTLTVEPTEPAENRGASFVLTLPTADLTDLSEA
jgi:signal transduction histidine kinase